MRSVLIPHILIHGELVCQNDSEAAIVHENLPQHIKLSRQEPGCITFKVLATEDPLVWQVSERFESCEAFAAHQSRVQVSEWGRATVGIQRRYVVKELSSGNDLSNAMIPTRLATPEDAPEIAAMLHDFNLEFENVSPSTTFLQERLAKLLDLPECFAVVPKYQSVAFGIVTLRPSIWTTGNIAVLEELYTKPDFRSRGFGKAILDTTIDEARRRDATDFTVEVDESDTKAHRFYDRSGFPVRDPEDQQAAFLLWREIGSSDSNTSRVL